MLGRHTQQMFTAVWSWKGHLCFWVPEIQLQNTELILFTDVLTLN